jgi:hypothetical protein
MRILHCVKGREMLRLFSDKDRSVNLFSNNLFANACILFVTFYLSSKFKLLPTLYDCSLQSLSYSLA